jgi:two-component system OmpR family response regulator
MGSRIVLGNLSIDRDSYRVDVGSRPVRLSYLEFEALSYLAENAGRVVPPQQLLAAVWGDCGEGSRRKLRVLISRLRKKVRESQPWQVQTVTKRGYGLLPSASESQGLERGA